MSDMVFSSFEEFEADSKRKSEVKGKALKILFIILFSLLMIEGLVYLFAIPCMNNVKVTFKGLKNCSQQEIVSALGDRLDRNYMHFSKSEVQSIVASIPGVEDVKVVRRFPDRVYINITEREPVAVTFINSGERTVPIQIDKNGVLFPVMSSEIPLDGSVPIVSGIPVENIPEGMRLPSKYHLLIDQIADIQSVNRKYFAAVSEIHVVPREYGNFELILIPVKAHLRVLADRVLNEETLQKMMVTLDVVKGLDKDVDVIDLRYGSVSYHLRSSRTGVFFE
jgi:cell division protein FtsQ